MKKEDGKLGFIPMSGSEVLTYGLIPRAKCIGNVKTQLVLVGGYFYCF